MRPRQVPRTTKTANGTSNMHMSYDIYASILHPRDAGSFLVIVSAFPTEPGLPPLAQPYGTRTAATLDEAQEIRDDLVASVASAVRERGEEPRRIVFR